MDDYLRKLVDRNGCVIIRKLGQGAFGEVFHVQSKSSKKAKCRDLVIKVGKFADSYERDALIDEGEICSCLGDHPNILKTFETSHHSSSNIVVMWNQFCNGGTVEQFAMHQGAIAPEKCIRWFCELMDGLAFVHSQDILHRDIKPENILLHNDSIVIGDFGLAKNVMDTHAANLLQSNTCTGNDSTYLFMAPEVHSKNYARRVDVWWCAMIIYCLLLNYSVTLNNGHTALGTCINGMPPGYWFHTTKSARRKMAQHMGMFADRVFHHYPRLKAALQGCLHPDKSDRFYAEEALAVFV